MQSSIHITHCMPAVILTIAVYAWWVCVTLSQLADGKWTSRMLTYADLC